MGWSEIVPSREGSTDTEGTAVAVRRFRVWDVAPDQIRTDPASVTNEVGQTLPTVGSDFDGLTCDSIGVSPVGPNLVEFVANYSNDGRFTFQPFTRIVPQVGVIQYGASFQSGSFDLPVGVFRETAVSGEVVSTLIREYAIETISIATTYRRHVVTVVIPSAQVQEAIAAMDTQHNRLHLLTINGQPRVYRFEAGDLTKNGRDYQVDYAWVYDPGTENAPPFVGPQGSIPPVLPSGLVFPVNPQQPPISIPGQFSRPPYCTILVTPGAPSAGGDPTPPRFDPYCPFRADPLGWQSLVGLT